MIAQPDCVITMICGKPINGVTAPQFRSIVVLPNLIPPVTYLTVAICMTMTAPGAYAFSTKVRKQIDISIRLVVPSLRIEELIWVFTVLPVSPTVAAMATTSSLQPRRRQRYDFNFGNTGALGDGDTTFNDFIDLGAWYADLGELHADQADDGILGQSNTVDDDGNATDYSDNTQSGVSSIMMQRSTPASYTADNTGVICVTSGTAIRTLKGDVLIDDLHVGDLVSTLDNGPRRIVWIGQRQITRSELLQNNRLHPVRIKKGALGAERNLLVSRQHGMLMGQDYLARAVHLAKTIPAVRIAAGKWQVTSFDLMFEAHQIVFAQGVPSESSNSGPIGLEALSNVSRKELMAQLPMISSAQHGADVLSTYGDTARALPDSKRVIDTRLFDRSDNIEKEMRKRDVDHAMAQFEFERLFETKSNQQSLHELHRVA